MKLAPLGVKMIGSSLPTVTTLARVPCLGVPSMADMIERSLGQYGHAFPQVTSAVVVYKSTGYPNNSPSVQFTITPKSMGPPPTDPPPASRTG